MGEPPVPAPRPRVAPGGLREIGPLAWLVSRGAGAVEGTTPPNIFLTLGRRRKLFRGWLHFAARLMPAGGLPRREGEMVILRVAHLRDCRYEFQHHVGLARRAGLTRGDVERVVAGPDDGGWTGRDRAVLSAVDCLHRHRDLDDATWAALRAHLTEPECVELLMLAGHYDMLATVIAALRIQPDRPRRAVRPAPPRGRDSR